MEYLSNFESSFSSRTLDIIKNYDGDYDGDYDATLVINCLLGLLIVPNEKMLKSIPEDPLEELQQWGIDPKSIINPGRWPGAEKLQVDNLRGLVTNLRHAVAHFNISPMIESGEVRAFEYKNGRGLHAIISLEEMKKFVKILSEHLSRQ